MNSVPVGKNWFSRVFTNNLIRLMSKQYLQFRHERRWGKQAMQRGQLDGGGALFF